MELREFLLPPGEGQDEGARISRYGTCRPNPLTRRLRLIADAALIERGNRLAALARTLDAVSPLQTLHRGYAIVTDEEGSVASSVSARAAQDKLSVWLHDGTLRVTVNDVVAQPPLAQVTDAHEE